MGFSRTLAHQLAEPRGLAGALLGRAMDLANRAPTRMAIDLLAPARGEIILDAGCGTGAAMAAVLRRARCRMIGVDRSDLMIARAAARFAGPRWSSAVELHAAALESLPCRPGSLDAALALNMLYFCDEDAGMVAAIFRALRPGGRMVAYVTHRRTMERWGLAGAGRHRLYDEAELARLLQDGGFDPARIRVETRALAFGVIGLFAIATKAG